MGYSGPEELAKELKIASPLQLIRDGEDFYLLYGELYPENPEYSRLIDISDGFRSSYEFGIIITPLEDALQQGFSERNIKSALRGGANREFVDVAYFQMKTPEV